MSFEKNALRYHVTNTIFGIKQEREIKNFKNFKLFKEFKEYFLKLSFLLLSDVSLKINNIFISSLWSYLKFNF
jgi:hypothetical protein